MKNEDIEKVLKYNNKNIASMFIMLFFICTIISVLCISITDSLSLILAFVFGIIALLLWCLLLLKKIKSKRVILKYGIDELKEELLSEETIKVNKKNIYLTPNYIIANNGAHGVQVTNYTDIVWIYPTRIRGINGVTNHTIGYATNRAIGGSPLMTHLKNGKAIISAIPKDMIGINIIFDKISQKNKKVMFGYTKENINKYKKINTGYKNQMLYTYIIVLIIMILVIIITKNM